MDEEGYWWQNDDGSYPVSQWQWLDGNLDGISECYYFDAQGYMLKDTTAPDGYTVNDQGAWVIDGVVQTMTAGSPSGNDTAANEAAAGAAETQAQNTDTAENDTAVSSVNIPSSAYRLGGLAILPGGEFAGADVTEAGESLTITNADGTRAAVILYTDMTKDPDYKAVMDSAASLGIDLNSDIMKSMVIDTFVESFASTMGSQPLSITDSIYPSGSWRQLRYAPEATSGTYTDIFIKYDSNAFYAIVFGGVGNYADVAYFMNSCVF